MRRAVLVLLVLGLVGGGAAFFWPRPHRGGALVITPNPIDFGDVAYLESAKQTIEIRNVSSREVLLKDPVPSCSCLSLLRAPESIRLAPGRSTTIEILLYTPKTEPGRLHKTFTVESDDPVAPRLDVPVIGNIRNTRTVTPREVSLGSVDAGAEPVSKVVEVRGAYGYVAIVTGGQCTDPRVTIQWQAVRGGSDVSIRTAKGAAKGKLEAQVALTLEVTAPGGSKRAYPEIVWVHGEFR